VSAAGILSGHFWLFCFGAVLWGVFVGCGSFYRFAAADSAPAALKGRAISMVMTGGVIAAVAGPSLARYSRDWLLPHLFAGSYLATAALAAISLIMLQIIRIAPPTVIDVQAAAARPLAVILRQPAVIAALLSAALGFAVMSFIMTATPLAMLDCGLDFGATTSVIQLHVLGMFVPSFFTGRLIGRFGERKMLATGAVLTCVCVGTNLLGVEFDNFLVGLLLLGIGWNFLYVGGSSLFSRLIEPRERGKAQAAFDFIVFGCASAASLAAGVVHASFGWTMINIGALPLMAVTLAGIAYWALRPVHTPRSA
jgi:predicted MFS family arabinose efflux permease